MPMVQTPIAAATGAASNGGRRPTLVAAPVAASPELADHPRRRIFTAQDKLRILAATDRAATTGGIGAILRREGIYSSALTDWRRQRDAGAFGALAPAKRGPKTAEANPLAAEMALLQRDNARLTRRLARAEAIIGIQKKSCGVAGHPAGAQRRRALSEAVVALTPAGGMIAAICAALGVSRATVQRRRARLAAPPAIARPRHRPMRALTTPQQQVVLDLLHAPRFADQAPAEIYACLLDQGVYHCSIRTMYRLLGQNGEVRDRRRQLRHPAYQKPELLACRPFFDWYNQDHHHAGLGLMTPHQVHYGQADAVHAARQSTLATAFRQTPERFVNKEPTPPEKPVAAWINPPTPRTPA